jgi:transposase
VSGLAELSREELIALVGELSDQVTRLLAQVEALRQENEMLRKQLQGKGPGNNPPSFVKANRPKREPKAGGERKKRPHSFNRKREIPTEEIRHAPERCPDCGHQLSGGSEVRRRQQIELPPMRIRVIDHVIIQRYCGRCKQYHEGSIGSEYGVIGKHRVGARLMALIATLNTGCRVTVRGIQALLEGVWGVHLSTGEISEILHAAAELGEAQTEEWLAQLRAAPVVHGDETGWREDGINGYLWSFSTPWIRYFHRDRSRAAQVAKDILGEDVFAGVLVCDFYGGYSWYTGPIQRCWVHLNRDLGNLLEAHPEDASVKEWVEAIGAIYQQARAAARREHSEDEGRRWRRYFEQRLLALAEPFLKNKDAPQYPLAYRIQRFQSELFTFVQYQGVPSGNNLAERAIRPAVTTRKVCGGTRSPQGSKTKATLLTLFGTWNLRKLNPFEACVQLLHTRAPTLQPAPA